MDVKSSRAVDDALDSVREAERKLEIARREVHTAEVHADATAAFAQTLQEVLGDRALAAGAARRAALTAAAATVWEDVVGPLLSGAQARELLGGVSRQRLDQLVKSGRLIVLQARSGARRYPAWQFDAEARPLPALVSAHRTLVMDGRMSPWSAASWCVHQHRELDGRSPRAWALDGGDPDRLALVAGRDAARAAQ
jgi:hypothetical protein